MASAFISCNTPGLFEGRFTAGESITDDEEPRTGSFSESGLSLTGVGNICCSLIGRQSVYVTKTFALSASNNCKIYKNNFSL